MSYTPAELMTVVAARELRDGEVVFVGIGLPNLACNLARATHAPDLVLIYESGAVGAVPERLPVSIGDPSLVTGSLMVCGMADVFQSFLQNGRIEVGFLGGAQIDRYQVQYAGGSQTCAASPCRITGLTNGRAYTFRVLAHNAVGNSAPSPANTAATSSVLTPGRIISIDASIHSRALT